MKRLTLILFLALALVFTIAQITSNSVAEGQDQSYIYQGFVSNDDTVQRYLDQWWTDKDKTLKAGNLCYNYKGYGTALRFTGVDIPEGAIIREATITLTACPMNYYLGGSRLYIYGEDARSPEATISYQDHVDRPRTLAYSYWTRLPAWYPGEKYSTPDFSLIVQEIVDKHAGTGDSMTIFIEDPWFDCPDGRYKIFASLENDTYDPPYLEVVYESPTPPASSLITVSAGINTEIPYGSTLVLTAVGNAGCQFQYWTIGQLNYTQNPLTIQASMQALDATATFAVANLPITYQIAVELQE